ncbi:hypothetical protein AGR8A_Cc40041 [Agrobacterium fabrum str. J-07]|nr:hypothetical protein AGR8A_Cc40041 [Agrobacterium fabrum str. J-07]
MLSQSSQSFPDAAVQGMGQMKNKDSQPIHGGGWPRVPSIIASPTLSVGNFCAYQLFHQEHGFR